VTFLENLSLGSLVAPVAEAEFRTRYWEQKPLIVHRDDRNYYGDLFTLRDFDDAMTRAPSYVKIANEAIKKHGQYKSNTARGLDGVLADMRDGSTLVLDQWHHREPKLGLLCRSLAQEVGHAFQTNLYLTPPNGKGFPPHWDNHDVFVLQVLGSKRWKIEKERRAFPDRKDVIEKEGRELRGELYDFTLMQGDVIYIPRGFVHAAECGSEHSLHITLGVTSFFWSDLLHTLIKAAILRDQSLRAAMPLGFLHGDRQTLVNRMVTAMRDASDESFIGSVVDQYRDELVGKFPLDVSGQIEEFFQPTSLALDDVVGPRRGIVYRMHVADDSVRLTFGGRSIVFLDIFREALEFTFKTQAFAIRDLPGDLADEEKVVFIERLVQEGLVVRK